MEHSAEAISVRPLTPDFSAWDGLLALILRAFAFMDGVIDPPSSALALTPQNLRAKAAAETVFLAWENKRLVGCLFCTEEQSSLRLGKLAVEPELQNRGVGRKLVAAAEDFARRRAAKALELQTRVELAGNHAAFRKLGFAETRRTAHPGFPRPTSITMRKDLA